MGIYSVMFAQQQDQSIYVVQYFSSIKLFADMKMGEHFTHQVLLTVNSPEWLLRSDDGSFVSRGICYCDCYCYIQMNKSHACLEFKRPNDPTNAGPSSVC